MGGPERQKAGMNKPQVPGTQLGLGLRFELPMPERDINVYDAIRERKRQEALAGSNVNRRLIPHRRRTGR